MPIRTPQRRAGTTVLEIIVSMILLGVVLSMIAPMTKLVVRQRKQAEARRTAIFEVSNQLERLLAEPSNWPAEGEARSLDVPKRLQARFHEPALAVRRIAVDEPPGARLDATFTWEEPNGSRAAPITLSAFSFDDGSRGAP